jgi:hypothetical protein
MKDETLKRAMREAGAKGGKRNTKAQTEARKRNAEKARQAKAGKIVK